MGSIPTRSRQHSFVIATLSSARLGSYRRLATATLLGLALTGALASVAPAQRADSTRVAAPAPTQRAARDTLAPPVSPRRAFLYSLAVPGLAQSILDRGRTGGLFFLSEVFAIAMATKSAADLRFAKAHAKDSVVTSYEVDATTGLARLDSLGRPIPAEFERNRYADLRVRARRTHLEDWYAFIIFNHLLAGAEAFVSAQLWDFPAHLSARQGPMGAVDLVVTVPW